MNFRIDRFPGCLAVFFVVEGPGVWVSSELISNFDFVQVWVHQSLIKLWFSKVWIWSKFDQTLILKFWFYSNFEFWNSKFRQTLSFQSLSFVKVWLYKLIVLSNFDSNVKTLKVNVYKSNFDKTETLKTQSLTKLGVSKLKVWVKSDFQNQSLIKLWSNSDFWKSKFDEALMKLRLSKFKVWSNFDETQTLFWTLLFFHTQLFLFSWNIDCPSHISKKKGMPLLRFSGIGANFRLSALTGWRSTESLDAGSMLAIAQWQSTSFSQKERVKENVKGFLFPRFRNVSFSQAFQGFPLAESSLVR